MVACNLPTHPITVRVDSVLIASGITIGLTQGSLTVPEETSPLEVCAAIHSGSIAVNAEVNFMLKVVSGTATEGKRQPW